MLYRAGNWRGAKELLCDQREFYVEFKQAGAPCQLRSAWEVRAGNAPALTASAVQAFRPQAYDSTADCLTAAHAAGAPLSACTPR